MALQPYEILLRFNDLGNYQGGHTIRRDNVTGKLSDAQAIGADTEFPWPDVASEVNAGSMAQIHTLQQQLSDAVKAGQEALGEAVSEALAGVATEKQSALDAAASAQAELADTRAYMAAIIAKAKDALADNSIDESERASMIADLVAQAEKPSLQRQKYAIQARIAELQAQAEALPV